MRWLVLADELQRNEFLSRGIGDGVSIEWISTIDELDKFTAADVVFDLLFDHSEGRKKQLLKKLPATLIINSVIQTLPESSASFTRINAWPGFLGREKIEASQSAGDEKPDRIFSLWNRKVEWVPDVPGFISPRIVCMIINEAFFALEEEVSTKQEIDTAMKLGTNYPFGPFEWSEKIGLKNVYALLEKLSATQERYKPAALLTREASRT
jgi:3-hydroxybutyryl-CoA dehydrogenase